MNEANGGSRGESARQVVDLPACIARLSALVTPDRHEQAMHGGAHALVQAYIDEVKQIARIAEHDDLPGLLCLTNLLEGQLLGLLGEGQRLSEGAYTLLEEWPMLLAEYSEQQHTTHRAYAIDALVAYLEDPRWPVPLASATASAARELFIHTEDRFEKTTVTPKRDAQAEAKLETEIYDALDDALDRSARIAGREPLGADAFARVDHATQITWLADLARRKGVHGVVQTSLHVLDQIKHWKRADTFDQRLTADQQERLTRYVTLARAFMNTQEMSTVGDAPGMAETLAADALLTDLADSAWPAPLSADETTRVRSTLMQARRQG